MDKDENALSEEYFVLENHLKEVKNKIAKYTKEKEALSGTNDYLKKLLSIKQREMMSKYRIMNSDELSNNRQTDLKPNSWNLIFAQEEIVMKSCLKMCENFYRPLDIKMASDTSALIRLGRKLNVNYIVVKKLEIREDWLLEKKVEISPEFFDNMKNLEKVGKLNYNSFKKLGSLIFFRVFEETNFKELKKKACEFWNLSLHTYKLYDEGFNNLDLVLNVRIVDYYLNYESTDATLKQGFLVLYLIEKIKYQTSFLDLHLPLISTKGSSNKDDDEDKDIGKYAEYFLQCSEYLKSGTILKGINKYRAHKYDKRQNIEYSIRMADNYYIFILLTIIFIILSITSISIKKNVYNNQLAYIYNKGIFQSYLYNNNLIIDKSKNNTYNKFNFTEMRDYLYYYTNIFNDTIFSNQKTFFTLTGPIRIRFFRISYLTPCPYDLSLDNLSTDTSSFNICYEYSHSGKYINKTGVYIYNYSENLNVTYTLNTKIMYYDTSGTIVELSKFDPNVNQHIKNLEYICENYKKFLLFSLRAFEISFTYYIPWMDLFVTNLILVERDQSNLPLISIHEVIPFKINMYETESELIIYNLDLTRLIIVWCLMASYILRSLQTYLKNSNRSYIKLIKSFFTTFFQIKNIILFTSAVFYTIAFLGESKTANLSSNILNQSTQYFDYYSLARSQKNNINLEILSLFLITVYSLKYFQIFQQSNLIFLALKKSSREFFLLFIIIIILFLGLSLVTYYVYSQFISRYQSFTDCLYYNINTFILNSDIYTTELLSKYYKNYSIVLIFLFCFIIKYFLLNLFFPILIEKFRMESENLLHSEDEDKITFKESIYSFYIELTMFLFPFRKNKSSIKN